MNVLVVNSFLEGTQIGGAEKSVRLLADPFSEKFSIRFFCLRGW